MLTWFTSLDVSLHAHKNDSKGLIKLAITPSKLHKFHLHAFGLVINNFPLFHVNSICDIVTHLFWSTLLNITWKNELGIKTNKKKMPYQHWGGERGGGDGVRQQSTPCLMVKKVQYVNRFNGEGNR